MFRWLFRVACVSTLGLACLGVLALSGDLAWWPAAFAAGAVGYVALAFVLRRLAFRLLCAPFKAKGAVLRGASVQVHGFHRTEPPNEACSSPGCDDEHDSRPRRDGWSWFIVDATISPAGDTNGPFQHWIPAELCAVPGDCPTAPTMGASDPREHLCSVERVELRRGAGFVADSGDATNGPERVRLLLACAPGVTTVKLRYYFEGFGRMELAKAADREPVGIA
jgi:hypothetical protein